MSELQQRNCSICSVLLQCKLCSFSDFGNSELGQGSSLVRSYFFGYCKLLTIHCRHWYTNGSVRSFDDCCSLMTISGLRLGLNRDSSKWKMHGHDLFSEEETQVRRQIWWACVISDR